MADHLNDDPAEIARDILSAKRDCGVCGGSGKASELAGEDVACGLCEGEGVVPVYGPNVRALADAFLRLDASEPDTVVAIPTIEELRL